MPCKKCLEIKNNNNISENQCFFHDTKNIILNHDVDTIKKWIDGLYNKHKLKSSVFIFNNNSNKVSLYKLVTATYPKLLRQVGIYKKGNRFVEEITNYILETSRKGYVNITTDTIKTYIKNVKLNIKNINISLFREQHFIYCITKQGLSLNDSLKYCFTNKKGKDIQTIIIFYRERDRILWSELYHLPCPIVSIIIKAIG